MRRGSRRRGTPRLRVPQRNQVEIRWASLDQLLEPDHPARMVWAAVCGLDLGRWLCEIRAVEGAVGRDATDPRLLVALWVYATLDAVGSAREVARLSEKHLAYQWLCGGVTVNYHLLSDFRSQGGDKWDDLLTQIVGSLLAENLVTMKRVAQDGMRVRASAGKASFRRRPRLEAVFGGGPQAGGDAEATGGRIARGHRHGVSVRHSSARRPSGNNVIEEAIRNCEQLQQQREKTAKTSGRKAAEARASTTDPEARHDEVSRRRVPARLQRSIQHRHGKRHHRGRGRDQPRHRQRRVAADAGSTGGAL